jgi:pimeloyl-ACP methyl ester carboxylesterase
MHEHALIQKDLSLYYNIYGSGETNVVLLHGFGEDSRVWLGLVDQLQKHYKLIVPDLRGSGRSTGSMENLSMDILAADVELMLAKENVTSCFMIGHSMGGYVTLAYAEKFPGRLEGLGLFHSTAFADSDEKKQTRRKNVDFIRKHGSAKFIEQANPNLFSGQFKQKNPEIVKEFTRRYSDLSAVSLVAYTEAMMNRPDRTEVLKKFPKPVLLIIGEHDLAIPLEQSLKLCQIADFSYIYIATQSGHMGMLEEPEFCLKAIQDFLTGS